ncbi:uncharacterized protein LOC135499421 [Lineus longissimus]|uniref:uncharacterized protein LOC135499421 n=1 Tax=Lineus longissimus TaxID=88925 RepID=UPI00315DFFFE
MVSLRGAIGTVVLAVVLYKVVNILYLLGLHKTIFKHVPGPCQLVDGVKYGSEDMEMTSGGLVFITSGMSIRAIVGDHPSFSKGKGRILLFDMKHPEVKVTPLKIHMQEKGSIDMEKFTPHGISLWEEKNSGVVIVLVVNHPNYEADRVERFEYRLSDGRFTHVRSYSDPMIGMLNDVVMTSSKTFYSSNYLYSSVQWKRYIENILLSWGGVFYFNGKDFKAVIPTGFYMPNGLAKSRDGKYLYLINNVSFLNVYKILASGSLELVKSHNIYTGADNIFVDETGVLWIGAHPVPWQTFVHCANADFQASSQVLRIKMDHENITEMVEILSNDGSLVQASASAIEYNKRLLVGTVQKELLYCDITMPHVLSCEAIKEVGSVSEYVMYSLNMVSLRGAIGTVVLAVVLYKAVNILHMLGLHKTIFKHLPGPCQLVDGVKYGSEDMEMTSGGLVFITSGFSARAVNGDHPSFSKGKGQILLFDMKRPEIKVTPLKIHMQEKGSIDMEKFTPHGISLWEEKNSGVVIVLVVNHPNYEADRVERFEFRLSDGRFTHVRSYSDPMIGMFNDVVMMSGETFYASNFFYSSVQWKRHIESILMLSWGGVFYFNGKDFKAVIPTGFFITNGLAKSRDGKYLYLINNVSFLNVYKILDSGSLELVKSHNLHTGADNIFVDETGALWTGAHPIGWQIVAHCENADVQASSQVLRIKMDHENITDIVEILSDDGSLVQASTSAVEYNKRLLVGTVQKELLYCDITMPVE